MEGFPVAVFLAVSFSVVLLGVVVGPIPTHPTASSTATTTTSTGLAELSNTYDTHNINVTALTLDTNTTYIPFTSKGTTFTLADGTYDTQKKTLVVKAPNNLFVETTWGTMSLVSDTDEGEQSVELQWSTVNGVGPRWHVTGASTASPVWFPGSGSHNMTTDGVNVTYAYVTANARFISWCDFAASFDERYRVSQFDVATGRWDSGVIVNFPGSTAGACVTPASTFSMPDNPSSLDSTGTMLVAKMDIFAIGVATRVPGDTAWTHVYTTVPTVGAFTAALRLSGDGTTMAFATNSFAFEFWKWNGTAMNHVLRDTISGTVEHIAISHDGQTIVVADTADGVTDHGNTLVWEDDGTGNYSNTFSVTITVDFGVNQLDSVDLSGDGLVLVVGNSNEGPSNEGGFYIYRRTRRSLDDWTLVQTVICTACSSADRSFGEISTDFTGDVITAMKATAGASTLPRYIFVRDKATDVWTAAATRPATPDGEDWAAELSDDGRTYLYAGEGVTQPIVYR